MKPSPRSAKILLEAVLILALCTLLALAFDKLGIRAENCLLLYLIGAIILIIEAQNYFAGPVFGVVSALVFNYLFTEPRMTLRVNDANQILTIAIFLVICVITTMLVQRLQNQISLSRRLAQRTQALFEISSGYLTLSGMENILYYGLRSLYKVYTQPCIAYISDGQSRLTAPYYIAEQYPDASIIEDGALAKWCFSHREVCGAGTKFYPQSLWMYFPIEHAGQTLGVLGIYCKDHPVDEDQQVFVGTVLSQMALAIERENAPQAGIQPKS